MKTAMESIKEMVDVNTIVGEPVETPDGSVIIPISRVSFGFAAGGSEFETKNGNGGARNATESRTELPFGGGSGAGVTVQPAAFLVVGNGQIRLLPIDRGMTLDRVLEAAPKLMEQAQHFLFREDRPARTRRFERVERVEEPRRTREKEYEREPEGAYED